jgi:hypothetical protein
MSSETLQPLNGFNSTGFTPSPSSAFPNGNANTQTKTKAEVEQLDEQLKKSKYEPAFHGDFLIGVSSLHHISL